jgi:class 3 adenylate cyclase
MSGAVSDERTFLFADLAGFTALTEAHGDDQAVDLVDRFFDAVRELAAEHDAEEVKTLGDAVMLCCSDPSRAIELGVRIVDEIGGTLPARCRVQLGTRRPARPSRMATGASSPTFRLGPWPSSRSGWTWSPSRASARMAFTAS